MENLLNKGFNFAILPLKLDLTQVLVDFKRFERSMIWHEFFHGKDIDNMTRRKFSKQEKIIYLKITEEKSNYDKTM